MSDTTIRRDLAVETGLRKEELFGLTLAGIDLARREVVLDRTKSGAPRRVPLSDAAITTVGASSPPRTGRGTPPIFSPIRTAVGSGT